MSDYYSYENEQGLLLVKALTHYRERLNIKPLTPLDPQYSFGIAHGIFTEPASPRAVSKLLTEAQTRLSDFGAINLYWMEGTQELTTKDLHKLATYTVAVYTFLIDLAFQVNHQRISYDRLIDLRNDLTLALREQLQYRQTDAIETTVPQNGYDIDPEEPTSYVYRFQMALALLCGNHLPRRQLCELWLNDEAEEAHTELQEWAINHSLMTWATGIGVIEAAMTLADTPDEGGDHEDRETAIARLFPEPKD